MINPAAYIKRNDGIVRPKRIPRICLKCNSPFNGRGEANRLCYSCRRENREEYNLQMVEHVFDWRYGDA